MMKIVVVGSINMDVVNQVKHHPQIGETVHGIATAYSAGGKGANQAVAAAKSGAQVTMLGAVGSDGFGQDLLGGLAEYGIHTAEIQVKNGTSGLAFITVSEAGENSIILSAGANGRLEVEDVKHARSTLQDADILLLQNEIPWDTTRFAMEFAHRYNVKVYLNPAPAMELPQEVYPWIDTLIVNESEASMLTGKPVHSVADARQAAQVFIEYGVSAAVVTLGASGSLYLNQIGTEVQTPSFPVKAVDTTAAGDTFIGALASRADSDIGAALRYATAAAALTVAKQGAQTSIPSLHEVEKFIKAD
ncbi:ribokinase [Alicyclobacillus sp. SO9]|uniref:ribokinase n=1 Tax=Alicyclobacillus sp. SO9 TaxID=2665646 RepID=UPI0018E8B310|nr:ribokinase [Alicyclobacillus sp. SO9]QQE79935.1 ribokinase [Alicyclobacillus sp. SO9]